jgi:branched-chain amino acid aminotransferase
MTIFINHNGKLAEAGKALISSGNRGLKYGDGLFETMKLQKTRARFADYHYDRLFHGMELLGFERPSWMNADYFAEQIMIVAKRNHHVESAKARLMIFRGDGGLRVEDNTPNFIVETTHLNQPDREEPRIGLITGIYPHARKSTDHFSSLKTNNFLPYLMAVKYASENQLDDCLLLNTHGRICDSTIANIFLIRQATVVTPSLNEGCIAGVMRRYLLAHLPQLGFELIEKPVTIEEVEDADEVFLTNAVQGIRFVQRFLQKEYKHHSTKLIRNALFNEIS